MNPLCGTKYTINFCGESLNICYLTVDHRMSISIEAELSNAPTKTIVFFQFYGEFKPGLERKWILDRSLHDRQRSPFYSSSDLWRQKWSDRPMYDLCSIGSIIFNTFIGVADKSSGSDPKKWSYEILCGFSWGLMSKDGVKVNPIPMKLLTSERLHLLTRVLEAYFPEGSFILSERCSCDFH